MQIPNGTGPGARRRKRPLLASRTRCNVLWKPQEVWTYLKILYAHQYLLNISLFSCCLICACVLTFSLFTLPFSRTTFLSQEHSQSDRCIHLCSFMLPYLLIPYRCSFTLPYPWCWLWSWSAESLCSYSIPIRISGSGCVLLQTNFWKMPSSSIWTIPPSRRGWTWSKNRFGIRYVSKYAEVFLYVKYIVRVTAEVVDHRSPWAP